MQRRFATASLLALGLALVACAGTTSSIPLEGIGQDVVDIPNAPAGDARARGAAAPPGREQPQRQYSTAELQRIAAQRLQAANALWCRAEQIEPKNPEAAADLFEDIVDDYPEYEKAARTMVETGGGVFSHTVGMAVHDVGGYRSAPLRPGQVFSIDPQLRVPEEKLYIRYEDTVVVTETGVENFTAFLPMELDEIEAVVRGKGVVQTRPALSEAEFDALRARER